MKREELKAALEVLAKKHNGHLSPEVIIEEARDPASKFHSCFDWNDATAAHRQRLAVARALIRAIRVEIRTQTHTFADVPIYAHDPRKENRSQGYISLQSADRENKRAILLDELERLIAQLGRTKKVAAAVMPGVLKDLESLSNAALAIVSRVKRAGDKVPSKPEV
jgi:hypothetical protein